MTWSTSDKMDHGVWGKELKHIVVKVGEWYELEDLSSILGSVHLVRSNPAVHIFTTELPWP